MTSNRPKNTIVAGSAQWIVQERRSALDMVMSDAEDFSMLVREEMEWLNEHMAQIFQPNMNYVDTMKTPAKLRGKTPRTARKQQPLINRAPLSNVFAPNLSSPQKTASSKPTIQFDIPQDDRNRSNIENEPVPQKSPPKFVLPPSTIPITNTTRSIYTDSGYHEATDDGKDVDEPKLLPQPAIPQSSNASQATNVLVSQQTSQGDATRTSHDSFVSAKENLTSRLVSEQAPVVTTELSPAGPAVPPKDKVTGPSPTKAALAPVIEQPMIVDTEDEVIDLDDDLQSPSEGPSPIKPLHRKSSLTFSSIPARELLSKSSFGPRASQAEASKSFGPSVGHLGLASGLRGNNALAVTSFSAVESSHAALNATAAASNELQVEDSEALKLHNKTSTQLLHDRINMLSQAREVRPSKSFHTSIDKEKISYPVLPIQESSTRASAIVDKASIAGTINHPAETLENDDDSWIAPIAKQMQKTSQSAVEIKAIHDQNTDLHERITNKLAGLQSSYSTNESPTRPVMHKKMASTTLLASPTRATMAPDTQKAISVSNPPNFAQGQDSTTPPNSPPRSPSGRKLFDGPISASKSKFSSLLKSAKGIFASSAGTSAQAKLDALPPPRSPKHNAEIIPSPTAQSRKWPVVNTDNNDLGHGIITEGGRRTRSSYERDLKRKAEEESHASDELAKARERERQRAAAAAAAKMNRALPPSKMATARPEAFYRAGTQESDDVFHDANDDMPPPPPPKSMLPTTNARMNQTKRVPVPRPTKDVASKAKPAPVTIRMPSQRIGQPAQPSTNTLNVSLHETLAPMLPPKTSGNTKAGGFTAQANSSTSSVKSANSSAKRALEAATKKKEQESKLAQQKAEKKRELEQKRAQRIEEERKKEEQRKAMEQQRQEEIRKTAQRQAEVKRLQREEQQRREPPRPVSRQNTTTSGFAQNMARGDVGQARPLTKMNIVHDPPRPAIQVNPVKPPKRMHPVESEKEAIERPVVSRNPPSYQQLEAKRRKTGEQEVVEARGSVMGPPVRHSVIRKEQTKYTHGYTPSHTTPHQPQSMLIKTVTSQHQQQQVKSVQQGEMTKYANGRIPFADGPSQPVTASQHKTPLRPNAVGTLSPYYTPGENIELPDIPSDSEDEDSENEWIAPSWTESPALREALRAQQLVDPEAIFGPIGALNMEEVFRENKDRIKKFRKRTSSANWSGIDRLTDSERKRDRLARERMEIDGGWDFQGQQAAMSKGKSPMA